MLCVLVIVVTGIQLSTYRPTDIIGSSCESTSLDLNDVAKQWFQDYMKQYKGIQVPSKYRLLDAEIKTIDVLDEEHKFVQIDFQLRPKKANSKLILMLGIGKDEGSEWYSEQRVLQFEKTNTTYTVIDAMLPAAYQIASDPNLAIEGKQPTQYLMADKDETYTFQNNKLYVTYDHGKTLVEVPIPYEDIVTSMRAYLPENSYVVRKNATGFIGYNQNGSYLIYSNDQGVTWNTVSISKRPGDGLSFLSATDQGWYATVRVDRSLGHDYYATYFVNEGQDVVQMKGEAFEHDQFSTLQFFDQQVAYFGLPNNASDGNATLLYSLDNGAHVQTITLPKVDATTQALGYNPFIEVETIYKEDGRVLVIVGQGDNGDYAKNNNLVKALYQSDDGVTFTFVKEVFDEAVLAG